jgi:signal transduction histidine kinase
MNLVSPNWKVLIKRAPFRLALISAILLAATAVISGLFLSLAPLIIEILLLLVVAALTFVALYAAAKSEWATVIERNELTSIIGALGDALILYGTDFTVIFFNSAAEKLFKLDAKTVLGHRLSPRDVEREGWRILIQVVFPSLAPRVTTHSSEGEYPQIADVSFTDPELEIRVTTAPVLDERGATMAFMKIVRDFTPQITALRAKDEFITVASHQLRGPVTDISWALQALEGATELSDANKGIVQNASAACQGLLRRIEDFLDVSRIEEGGVGYEFKEADIGDFLQKTLGDVLPAAKQAGIKLYLDIPSGVLPSVFIDQKRLSIVMINLIENAIRYNVEHGEVIVKVTQQSPKPFIEISVKDTGIGIPPEAISKLFTKFFRAENAVKSQTEGSGIGLYIARGIVRAHGGEIWAESELNRGTTIHLTLPTDQSLVPKHEVATGGMF